MGFHLLKSIKILIKTYPFILLTFFLYCVFGAIGLFLILLFILMIGLLGFSGFLFLILGIVFFGLFIGLFFLFKRYVLYLVKAAHIAVIADLTLDRKVPGFLGQFGYGKKKVIKRFGSVSALFVLDRLIAGVTGAILGTISFITAWIPLGSLKSLIRMFLQIIRLITNHIDEAIVAYIFINEDVDPWSGARDGLVLYAQKWKPILITCTLLVLGAYALMGVAWFGVFFVSSMVSAFLGPIAGEIAGFLAFPLALLLLLIIYSAFLNPLILVWIIVTYVEEIKNEVPNPKTVEWLNGVSNKFKEITSKAGASLSSSSIGEKGFVQPLQEQPQLTKSSEQIDLNKNSEKEINQRRLRRIEQRQKKSETKINSNTIEQQDKTELKINPVTDTEKSIQENFTEEENQRIQKIVNSLKKEKNNFTKEQIKSVLIEEKLSEKMINKIFELLEMNSTENQLNSVPLTESVQEIFSEAEEKEINQLVNLFIDSKEKYSPKILTEAMSEKNYSKKITDEVIKRIYG
jgi:hypothetical protein